MTNYFVPTLIVVPSNVNYGQSVPMPGHPAYVPGTDVTDALRWWLVQGASSNGGYPTMAGTADNPSTIYFRAGETYYIEYGIFFGNDGNIPAIKDANGVVVWPVVPAHGWKYTTFDGNGATLRQANNQIYIKPAVPFHGNVMSATSDPSVAIAGDVVNFTGDVTSGSFVITNVPTADPNWMGRDVTATVAGSPVFGKRVEIVDVYVDANPALNTVTVANPDPYDNTPSSVTATGVTFSFKGSLVITNVTRDDRLSFRGKLVAGTYDVTSISPSPQTWWVGRQVHGFIPGTETDIFAHDVRIASVNVTDKSLTVENVHAGETSPSAYTTPDGKLTSLYADGAKIGDPIRDSFYNVPFNPIGKTAIATLDAITPTGDFTSGSFIINNVTDPEPDTSWIGRRVVAKTPTGTLIFAKPVKVLDVDETTNTVYLTNTATLLTPTPSNYTGDALQFTLPSSKLFNSGSKVASYDDSTKTITLTKGAVPTLVNTPFSISADAIEPRRRYGIKLVSLDSPVTSPNMNMTVQNFTFRMGNDNQDDSVYTPRESWHAVVFGFGRSTLFKDISIINAWGDTINFGGNYEDVTIQNVYAQCAGRHSFTLQGQVNLLVTGCRISGANHWFIDCESFQPDRMLKTSFIGNYVQSGDLGFMSWHPAPPICDPPMQLTGVRFTAGSKIMNVPTGAVPSKWQGALVNDPAVPAGTYILKLLDPTTIELSQPATDDNASASPIIRSYAIIRDWLFQDNLNTGGNFAFNGTAAPQRENVWFYGSTTYGSKIVQYTGDYPRVDGNTYPLATNWANNYIYKTASLAGVVFLQNTSIVSVDTNAQTITLDKAAQKTLTNVPLAVSLLRVPWSGFVFERNRVVSGGGFGAISGVAGNGEPMLLLPARYSDVIVRDNHATALLNDRGQIVEHAVGNMSNGGGFQYWWDYRNNTPPDPPNSPRWTVSGNYWANFVDNQYTPSKTTSVSLSAAPAGSTLPTMTGTLTASDGATVNGYLSFYRRPVGAPKWITMGTRSMTDNVAQREPPLTPLTPGQWEMKCVFAGDLQYQGSQTTIVFTVGSIATVSTNTSLSVAPTTVLSGALVTMTATVTPASSTISDGDGSVEFYANGDLFDTVPVDNPTGTASSVTATTSTTFGLPGVYTITAKYVNSAGFNPSTSSSVDVTVTVPAPDIPTFTTLTVSPNPAEPEVDTVTLHAEVGTPGLIGSAGLVTFFVDGVAIGGVSVVSGVAELAHVFAYGTYEITAQYSGTGSYLASSSSPVTLDATAGGISRYYNATPNP